MEYQGEAWMGYDHRFHQRATTNPHNSWSAIDTTLWKLILSGKGKQPVAATALALPTNLINVTGLLINYLLVTTTMDPILS